MANHTEDEEDEYELDSIVSRTEGAAALRRLADGVASGTVTLGGAVEVDLPEQFELEIEYEEDDDEAELDAELEWPVEAGDSAVGSAVQEGGSAVESEASEVGIPESKAHFELFEDRADEWRWRLVHDNGNIIADSGEGYSRKSSARKGLESVMRNAPRAAVIETTE